MGTGYKTKAYAFVNIIATPKGGTHMAGLAGLLEVFRRHIKVNARTALKVGNDKVDKDDVLAGLDRGRHRRLAEPQFEARPRCRARPCGHDVTRVVEHELTRRSPPPSAVVKAQAALLLEKVVAER